MAKPQWKAASQTPLFEYEDRIDRNPRLIPICANCGWRLAKVVGEDEMRRPLAWCAACEDEHGGQRTPAPRRLPELPTKKKNVDEVAVKDKLAGIGAIPITCRACGAGGHVSADCPTREAAP